MQTCLLSARCFRRGFHRKPSFDLNRQAHRCRLFVRLISILSTWFVAIAMHALYFYSFKLIPHANETYCELNWGPAFDHMKTHRGFVTANFITFIPIPICVLASVYSIIVWTIRKKNKKTEEKLSCRQNHRDRQLRNIVRLAVAIMISFVSCMTPLLIYLILKIFFCGIGNRHPAFQTVIPFICLFLMHSWSAVNPCICFIFGKNYRNGLKQCFYCNYLNRRISGLQEIPNANDHELLRRQLPSDPFK